jgi:hypothetical protein
MSAAVGFVDYPITKNPALDTAFMANTAKRLLADIRELAPDIKARAAEIEAGRRIPLELVEARAFHQVQAASHWRHALAGTLKDEALLTQGTQTGIWVATTCVRVADA